MCCRLAACNSQHARSRVLQLALNLRHRATVILRHLLLLRDGQARKLSAQIAINAFLHGPEDARRFLLGGDVLRYNEFDRTEALRSACSVREQARRARQHGAESNPKQFPFSCELCQVRTNTEQSLQQHFRGRAHRTSLIKQSMAPHDVARFNLLDGPSRRAFIDQQFGDRPIVTLDSWLDRNETARSTLHGIESHRARE